MHHGFPNPVYYASFAAERDIDQKPRVNGYRLRSYHRHDDFPLAKYLGTRSNGEIHDGYTQCRRRIARFQIQTRKSYNTFSKIYF